MTQCVYGPGTDQHGPPNEGHAMRIHTNNVDARTLRAAAAYATQTAGAGTVTLERCARYGSRSHAMAVDFTLSGDGTVNRRRVNAGTSLTADRSALPYATTYDAWGRFLAVVFLADPSATCSAYQGRADFNAKTHDDYSTARTVVGTVAGTQHVGNTVVGNGRYRVTFADGRVFTTAGNSDSADVAANLRTEDVAVFTLSARGTIVSATFVRY